MEKQESRGFWYRIGPALTLVILSPMVAEILPGATRISAIFVLPIEMGFWGIGALLIRAAVRRWHLGWRNLLLLAVALAFAEEFIVQQTSFAPLIFQFVKGAPYGREWGVNWLYLIWAVGYESVLVVVVPVMLTELIFPERREQTWVSKSGLVVCALLAAVASFFAWFSWTQIARVKVFHVPAYTPPADAMAIAGGAILVLIFLALGPARRLLARPSRPLPAPAPFAVALIAFITAVLWYALVILSYRIWPFVPPAPPAAAGVISGIVLAALYARWSAHQRWSDTHRFAVVAGAVLGSMGVGFVGFIGALPLDLYGKAILNLAALLLLAVLWFRLRQSGSRAGAA